MIAELDEITLRDDQARIPAPKQELLMRASLGFTFVTLIAVSAGVADEPKSKKTVKRDPKALEVL